MRNLFNAFDSKYMILKYFIFALFVCCFLCSCKSSNDNKLDIIRKSFNCNKDSAKIIEEVLDDCELEIKSSKNVSREKTKDFDGSFAYKIILDDLTCHEHDEKFYYVYLDYDCEIRYITIWSEYLYFNYELKQTYTQLHTKYDASYDVNFILGKDYVNCFGDMNQSIKYGQYATAPTFLEGSASKAYFLGWTIDGYNIIDVNTYKITEETNFTALWVKTNFFETNVFIPGGEAFESNSSFDFTAKKE